MLVCHKCQKEIQTSPGVPVGRREECPDCHSDLHVCLNCINYSPGSYNECKEPVTELVKEKDRANFCDYFSPSDRKAEKRESKEDLLAAAEALFKKK